MLGGRRTGKSTILASVIHALNNKASHLCTLTDTTPYGASTGMKVSLIDKRHEINNYLHEHKRSQNAQFLVDLNGTGSEGTFNIVASVVGAPGIGLDFVDVPGEWMCQAHTEYEGLKAHIKESDVFIIAIDTPFLMYEENSNVGIVGNRSNEVSQLMDAMNIGSIHDRKQIIFVPVKCEKWVREGRIEEVTQKVLQLYRGLINKWVSHKEVEMWVMPISTVGSIELSRILHGYRVFMKEGDNAGSLCSRDPFSNILMLGDGTTIPESKVYEVSSEPDKSLNFSYTQLPLSWYRVCGSGKYKPQLCEQVAFHILRFLIEKQENMSQLKYDDYCNEPWYKQLWSWLHGDDKYGTYAQIYHALVNTIPLKVNGDGFLKISEFVPDEDDFAEGTDGDVEADD